MTEMQNNVLAIEMSVVKTVSLIVSVHCVLKGDLCYPLVQFDVCLLLVFASVLSMN